MEDGESRCVISDQSDLEGEDSSRGSSAKGAQPGNCHRQKAHSTTPSTKGKKHKINKRKFSTSEGEEEDSEEELIDMGLDKRGIPRSKINDEDISRLIVKCTACNKQVLHKYYSKVRKHLHMGVLICEECADFYKNGEFSQDESGDKYCRWCGQGGTLIGCDYCHNVFCNICIKRNFGRGEWNKIQKQDNWRCYVCNPNPIKGLVAFCKMIVDYANRVSTGKKTTGSHNNNNHSRKHEQTLVKATKKKKLEMVTLQETLSPMVKDWLKKLVDEARIHMENKASELYKLSLELKNVSLFDEDVEELINRFCGKMRTLLFDHVKFVSHICTELKKKESKKKPSPGDAPSHSSKTKNRRKKSLEELEEEESPLHLVLSSSDDSKRALEVSSPPVAAKEEERSPSVEIQEDTSNILPLPQPPSSPPMEPQQATPMEEGDDETDIKKGLSKLINDVELGEVPHPSPSQGTPTNGVAQDSEEVEEDNAECDDKDKVLEMKESGESKSLVSKIPEAYDLSNDEAKNLLADLLCSDNEEAKPAQMSCKTEASLPSPRDNFSDSDEEDKGVRKPKLDKTPAVHLVKLDENVVKEYIKETSKETTTTKHNKTGLEKEVENLCRMSTLKKSSKTKRQPKTEEDVEQKTDEGKEVDKKEEKETKKNEEKGEEEEEEAPESDTPESDISLDEQIEKLLATAKDNLEEPGDEESEEAGLSEEEEEEDDEPTKKTKKKSKNSDEEELDSDEDFVIKKKKHKPHRLLTVGLSDSEDDKSGSTSSVKKRNGGGTKRKHSPEGNSSSDLFSSHSSDEDLYKKNKRGGGGNKNKKRRRIKQFSDSSADNSDADGPNSESTPNKGRKNIRKIFSSDKLQNETKAATQAEKERRKRVAERQKMYNQVVEESKEGEKITRKLVLEMDKETKEELVCIHPDLIVKLKPHQVEGVKFMWECTVESIKRLRESEGEGCVLAHCMGLGKTLQVIVFLHTVLTNPHTKDHLRTALVLCPYNTVLNWASEFEYWLQDNLKIKVYELTGVKDNYSRGEVLNKWKKKGGVLICGYDMFRILAAPNKRISKKLREDIATCLLDPGPDIVVCDEGHILKNINSAIAKVTSSINCKRRIVLTGTPLQNNLKEYHCMVQFVKPHLLGTKKEFQNRFVNPIMNGQCADSNAHDVHLMKKRAHILHSLLEGCVQRCDYGALRSFLPPKYEYVISIRLSETQIKMYRYFLDNFSRGGRKDSLGTAGTALFWDFNVLRQIWTHPYTFYINAMKRMENELEDEEDDKLKDFINDDSSSGSDSEEADKGEVIFIDGKSDEEKSKKKSGTDNSSSSSDEEKITKWKSRTRSSKPGVAVDEGASTSTAPSTSAPKEPPPPEPGFSRREWWLQYYSPEQDHVDPALSGKIFLLLDILRECEAIGDKVLLFSQSLLTLDLIEEVLRKVDEENEATDDQRDLLGSWVHGLDYFRMDGSTNVDYRKRWIHIFNDEDNMRARLFMISTKAGSLGTNLIGANRVIIMDASWNPTHDIQAIFRVYRFGQKKPVYIYRFLAQGTMEEKIYDRQVTKQSLSYRVLDEHQIERHFNAADLAELYSFNPDTVANRPTPLVPKDLLLADLLIKRKDWISTYHEHDSLLQNVVEEDLTEEERKLAWQEYEAEKEGLLHSASSGLGGVNLGANVFGVTLSQQPVSYDQVDRLPDAKADIAAIVESIKKNRPGISQSDLNSALMSVLIIRRSHQQQCHHLSVQQKKAFLEKNEPVPPELNGYLSALNVSIQQITHVIRSLNQQKNYYMYNNNFPFHQQYQTYGQPRGKFPINPQQQQQAQMFSQFMSNPKHFNHLREQIMQANRMRPPGSGDKTSYKVTFLPLSTKTSPSAPQQMPAAAVAAASTAGATAAAATAGASSKTDTTTSGSSNLPASTVTITEIE